MGAIKNGLSVGIVGTNFISDWFVAAARNTKGRIEPLAVYSRSSDRAMEFAQKNNVALAFDDYREMLSEVDIVYIASPTVAHFDQAMKAIESGCHVLVEKTATSNLGQAEDIFEAAADRGLVAMEATRSLHTPVYRIIREALPRLGTLRYAHFEKLQYSSRYDRFLGGESMNAFDPSLGNSALIDLGVYCIEPAVDLFGAPDEVHSASVLLGNGFEAGGSIQLGYPEMIADLAYSKIAAGAGPSTIVGETGSLEIDDITDTSHVVIRERGRDQKVLFDASRVMPWATMHHELNSFATQVESGETDPRWRDVSLVTRRIMDRHLEDIAIKQHRG